MNGMRHSLSAGEKMNLFSPPSRGRIEEGERFERLFKPFIAFRTPLAAEAANYLWPAWQPWCMS